MVIPRGTEPSSMIVHTTPNDSIQSRPTETPSFHRVSSLEDRHLLGSYHSVPVNKVQRFQLG